MKVHARFIGLLYFALLNGLCGSMASAQGALPSYFNVKDYGAVGDGVADDTAAINRAIAAAAVPVTPSLATGAVVYFPTGQYEITSTIDLPNRVALHGPNGRGAKIQASKSFGTSYKYMFHAYRIEGGEYKSMFGSRLVDLDLDFNDLSIAGSAVIAADSWQETCGLERVVVERFTQYGVIIDHGGGGAAYLPFKDIEVFGSPNGSLLGIKVGSIGTYGGFMLSIDGATFSGGGSTQLPIGIQLQDTLVARGLHFEQTTIGISHYGNGGLSVDTVTGGSVNPNGTNVGTLIELGAAFRGVLTARNMIGNGTSGPLITNNVSGQNINGGSNKSLALYVLDQQSTPASSPRGVLY